MRHPIYNGDTEATQDQIRRFIAAEAAQKIRRCEHLAQPQSRANFSGIEDFIHQQR
jgi:hypothetical protein